MGTGSGEGESPNTTSGMEEGAGAEVGVEEPGNAGKRRAGSGAAAGAGFSLRFTRAAST
jgi:hypothetical protein